MKRLGSDFEKFIAKKYHGKLKPNSGAFVGHKGDVEFGEYLVECKTTSKKSFSVKKEILDKIYTEALMADRKPIVFIRFEGSKYPQVWVMLDMETFDELSGCD